MTAFSISSKVASLPSNLVIYCYIRGFDGISLVTETKETGINGFHFNIVGIFFFDSPGQSAEICSAFSGRTIGINCYFNHDDSPP